MPPPPPNPVGTAGNILLVEEYEALAVAFATALRKFAGKYQTHVVRSLAEAENSLGQLKPDLFVLDFDPPPRGSVAFFKRLKTALPGSRVLIVAADKTPDLSETTSPRAFSFIQKPFELERFGAAIEALIGTDKSRVASGASALRDLSLVDMIVLHAATGANMVLEVAASRSRSGEIHFHEGRISHAAVMGQAGVAALQTIVRWPSPRYQEAERRIDAPRSIHGAWIPILTDALKNIGPSRTLAVEKARSQGEASKEHGKKIVVVDDTELLSIFVEEILISMDSTLEVATAHSGLDGLEQIEAIKPDLLLLDYSLPDITGGEVCRRLLENEATAGIPIIMMSGHVPEMTAVAERYENVVATIAKPFISDALVDLVDRTLMDLPELKQRRRKKPPAIRGSEENESGRLKPDKSKNGKPRLPKSEASVPEVASVEKAEPIVEAVEPQIESEPEPPLPEPDSWPVPESARVEAPAPLPPAQPEPFTAENAPAKVIEPAAEIIRPMEPTPILTVPEPEGTQPPPALFPIAPQEAAVPASINAARLNAIVVGVPLEVLSIQFSPALRIEAVSARLLSPSVSVHVLPQALPGITIPDAGFELLRVELDALGQISFIRLAPRDPELPRPRRHHMAIDGVLLAPTPGGEVIQLSPTAVAPMHMQFLALFELASVELTTGFAVACLVLKARPEKTRLTFLPDAAQTGATFDVAHVSLDPAAQISEILLHAV